MKSSCNIFRSLLFLILISLVSCSDKDLDSKYEENNSNIFSEGYSLDFIVTLDEMGGTRASDFNPMKEIEDYIDPQKFRVLFFDSEERFLFESKSRWVKKQTFSEEDRLNNVWYVSVPFFSFGNDEDENWDWLNIRKALTDGPFKIALIVNNPILEYSNEYANDNDVSDNTTKGWQKNDSPFWSKADSRFTDSGENTSPKTLFDIHHSQFDAVYRYKGRVSGYESNEGIYNFIMGDAPVGNPYPDNPKLSSFVSWVDFEGEETDQRNQVQIQKNLCRKAIKPTYDHPIPMYGVQAFQAIDPVEWKQGTAYNLNRVNSADEPIDLPISLLRSAVKLELVIPLNRKPDWITLMYSNIYSRSQPMDIWTPTNEIWYDENYVHNDDNCEMNAIMDYGPMIYEEDSPGTLTFYQQRLSWIYGKWLDRNWSFGSLGQTYVRSLKNTAPKFPSVFNPMIQRNSVVFCAGKYKDNPAYTDNVYEDGNNMHVIVYTGERNINDQSNQYKNSANAGNRTLIYFTLAYGSNLYTVPIADYSQKSNINLLNIGIKNLTGDDTRNLTDDTNYATDGIHGVSDYANYVSKKSTPKTHRPWPLLRNHIYRLYMFGAEATRSGEPQTLGEAGISSEVLYSPTLCFPNALKIMTNKVPISTIIKK